MSILKDFLRGVAWSMGMRWSLHLLGMLSTIIIARLLTPHDFGIVSAATIALGLTNNLMSMGVEQHLIRTKEATPEHCNTAWTLQVLQNLFVAILLALAAPMVAYYMDEPKVTEVIYLIAIATAVTGLSNIGVPLARKNLQFHKDFQFNVSQKLATIVLSIGLAVWLRSYWALALSYLISAFFGLALSYLMFKYRPRWSLARFKEYFRFSVRIIPLSIAKYLNDKIDTLIIGGMAGSAQLGLYNTSSELSTMATREVGTSISRGLYPNYAAIKDNKEQLNSSFIAVLASISLFIIPLGAGLSLCAEQIIPLLLGSHWLAAVPIIEWLAIAATLTSMTHLMTMQVLIVSGYELVSVGMVWLRLGLQATGIYLAVSLGGVHAIAIGVTLATAVSLPIAMVVLNRCLGISLTASLGSFWRPLVAALMMALALVAIEPSLPENTALQLMTKVAAGAIVYGLSDLLLWRLSGRPSGVEKYLVETLASRRTKFAN